MFVAEYLTDDELRQCDNGLLVGADEVDGRPFEMSQAAMPTVSV